jgi:hypothetical protein
LGVVAAACVLAACAGSGRPSGLDGKALAVADNFTRLALNEHDCRAASRYLTKAQLCESMRVGGMIPTFSHFPLTSHQIRRAGCRLGEPPGHQQPTETTGCIEYTASSGFLLRYGMTQTPRGWRIIEIGVSGGRPDTHAARLDRAAVAVTDAFTRLAWNKQDCLAGRRYLLPGIVGMACGNPTGTFPLKSHRIRPNRCGHGDWNGGYRISPGCIVYTASDGETLEYDMTKTPHGWRIIETGTASHSG